MVYDQPGHFDGAHVLGVDEQVPRATDARMCPEANPSTVEQAFCCDCDASYTRRARIAMSAASTRFLAPVVLRIEETWTLTVPGAR